MSSNTDKLLKFIIFLISIFILPIPFHGAAQDSSGLVAWWRFDEGEGKMAHDFLNRKEFDGKIINCEWVQGIKGKALKFNGVDSRVVVKPNHALDLTSNCTLSVWVNIDKDIATKAQHEIINKSHDRGPGYRLYFYLGTDPGAIRLYFLSGEGYDKPTWNAGTVPGKTNVSLGEWHHIAATYDGTKYKIYVDGEEAASLDETRGITTAVTNPLTIGGYINEGVYQFKGVIDEVKIYDRALTSLEIIKEAHME